ncbi:MAG: hypothetical protein ACLQRH_19870 [Acidimicrobiales bacterium]
MRRYDGGRLGQLDAHHVGVLTDVTGPGSSDNATTVQGVEAGVQLAKRDGYALSQSNRAACAATRNGGK